MEAHVSRAIASKAFSALVLYFKAWGLLIWTCTWFALGALCMWLAFTAALRIQGISL